MVLVAGLGDDHASWDPILEYLTPVYRCITFDNRGIGASPVTPGPYRIADLAADAHALHQALGLAPCVAIGSSMGGAIGQEWALRYPGDVTGLVLSNSWGRTDAFTRVLFEHWISLAGRGRADQLLDSMLLFCMSAAYLAARPDTVTEFRALVLPDLDGFQAAAAACLGHDALDRLGGPESAGPGASRAARHLDPPGAVGGTGRGAPARRAPAARGRPHDVLGDTRDLGPGRDALAGCAGLGLDQDAGDVGVLIQPVAGADAVVAIGDDQRMVVAAAQEQDRRQGLAR